MATDQGPVVQSALLRTELIRLRKDSGLTQEQVAATLDWSPSKVIRVEGGRSSITKVDLDALLTEYGITSESQRERLQALNRGARERAWWASYRDQVHDTYFEYVGYEAGAAFIRQFHNGAIPGLLQTREYAEVLVSNSGDASRSLPTVDLRMQRQSQLGRREEPPRQYFVLDEAAIRRRVGAKVDKTIMPAQLRHLADRAEQEERLTIRVLPFAEGAHPGVNGPFTLLEFDGAMGDILYIDSGREINLYTGNDERIGLYADDFEVLVESSLSAPASIELLRQVADEMS
jgi:transcriptional regulator with XRE-family HTH domain